MRFFSRVSFQKSPQISADASSHYWLHFKGFHPEWDFKCVLKIVCPRGFKVTLWHCLAGLWQIYVTLWQIVVSSGIVADMCYIVTGL